MKTVETTFSYYTNKLSFLINKKWLSFPRHDFHAASGGQTGYSNASWEFYKENIYVVMSAEYLITKRNLFILYRNNSVQAFWSIWAVSTVLLKLCFLYFSGLNIMISSQLFFEFPLFLSTETPPPGYISEDGEASDQQMNQSMETGILE